MSASFLSLIHPSLSRHSSHKRTSTNPAPPAPSASSVSDEIKVPLPPSLKRKRLADDEGERGDREKIRQVRKEGRVRAAGGDVPTSFDSLLRLSVPPPSSSESEKREARERMEELGKRLTEGAPKGMAYERPLPVQWRTASAMMADREVVAVAPTGEGKTVAFLLPLLMLLNGALDKGVRAIVVTPTRELARQTWREASKLAGDDSKGSWHVTLLHPRHISEGSFVGESARHHDLLIATPLTLQHLLESPDVEFHHVQHIVLDEADRLLDFGFLPQIDSILGLIQQKKKAKKKDPSARSYRLHMFSATMPLGLDTLINTLLIDPVRVVVAHRNTAQSLVKQELKFVGGEDGKLPAIRSMIQVGLDVPLLIFVQSSERARQLFSVLQNEGVARLGLIHSDVPEHKRNSVIDSFRSGEMCVLISTDILARGIDLKPAHCVLNFDFPQSTIDYIHRIGRTGRAGREGHAITFFTYNDKPLLRYVAGVMAHSGAAIPEWMMQMKKGSERVAKRLAHIAPPREPIIRQISQKTTGQKKRAALKRVHAQELSKRSSSVVHQKINSSTEQTPSNQRKKQRQMINTKNYLPNAMTIRRSIATLKQKPNILEYVNIYNEGQMQYH